MWVEVTAWGVAAGWRCVRRPRPSGQLPGETQRAVPHSWRTAFTASLDARLPTRVVALRLRSRGPFGDLGNAPPMSSPSHVMLQYMHRETGKDHWPAQPTAPNSLGGTEAICSPESGKPSRSHGERPPARSGPLECVHLQGEHLRVRLPASSTPRAGRHVHPDPTCRGNPHPSTLKRQGGPLVLQYRAATESSAAWRAGQI